MERQLGDGEGSHIVGPLAACDKVVLDGNVGGGSSSAMFRAVNRSRPGKKLPRLLGRVQDEILRNVVREGNVLEILDLYRRIIHPCFPILDSEDIIPIEGGKSSRLPPVLLSTVIAMTSLFWHESNILASMPQPNLAFTWNVAVDALNEGFQAPSISTMLAAILDLTGRPSLDILGNEGTLGRVVAFAHSTGLNREPHESAQLPHLRRRVWWCVVIHDAWSSLSHGTPSLLDTRYWDVRPLTRADVNMDRSRQEDERSVACFLALCSLTEILTRLLPIVYTLRPSDHQSSLAGVQSLAFDLHQWYDNLPTWLSVSWSSSGVYAGGALSLCLCYHAILITLARLNLRQARQSMAISPMDLAGCQEAAVGVAKLVDLLDERNIRGFWLPYSAEHFTMAMTVLLRCAVEHAGDADGMLCLGRAETMLAKLQQLRDDHGWDLGDECLTQSRDLCSRVRGGLDETRQTPQATIDTDFGNLFELPELTGFGLIGADGLFWNEGLSSDATNPGFGFTV